MPQFRLRWKYSEQLQTLLRCSTSIAWQLQLLKCYRMTQLRLISIPIMRFSNAIGGSDAAHLMPSTLTLPDTGADAATIARCDRWFAERGVVRHGGVEQVHLHT